jgi:hypothetical protein
MSFLVGFFYWLFRFSIPITFLPFLFLCLTTFITSAHRCPLPPLDTLPSTPYPLLSLFLSPSIIPPSSYHPSYQTVTTQEHQLTTLLTHRRHPQSNNPPPLKDKSPSRSHLPLWHFWPFYSFLLPQERQNPYFQSLYQRQGRQGFRQRRKR